MSHSRDPNLSIWDMTAGPMTPITPQWQGWVNDPWLTRSTTSLPGQAQTRAGIPQPRFAGSHQQLTGQAAQNMGVSQPHKNDTRAPPAAESSSSHHSTPSKGKASTPRDSAQLLERANINGDTIKWLNEEGLGSIDHLKLLTLKSTKELCNGKSPKLPFGQILALESLVATWAPDANASLQNQPLKGENATHQPPAEFRAPSTNLPAGNNLLQDNLTPPQKTISPACFNSH